MRTFFLAVVLAVLWAAEPAVAQRFYDIMVEEGGRAPKRPAKTPEKPSEQEPKKRAEPKTYPRGSSYIPPATLPRSEPARVAPNSVGVYKPPPINSFSDRVIGCNHSYPLNAGIGNNPTDRSAYVRQCAN